MASELIAEAITDYFGERCLDYAEGCPTCEAWAEYDRMNTRPAPAATDTGLETLSVELTPSGHPYMKSDPEGDYVTRSQAVELLSGRDTVIEMQADSIDKLERKVRHWQERADKAEELLAAERAEKEKLEAAWLEAEGIISDLKAELAEALRGNRYAQLERIAVQRAEKAEADNAAKDARIKHGDQIIEELEDANRELLQEIGKVRARRDALEAEQVTFNELCKLTFAIQHNPNCPDRFLIRLPGKPGYIDLKPYGDQLSFRKHETEDVIGAGPTLAAAFEKARAVLGGKPS